jgi:hypothetical protein
MHKQSTFFILALAVLTTGTADAQTPPRLPKNDVTVSLGWFGSRYPGLERYNRWHQSLLSGAGGGRYWTDHFKSEVEAAWLSRVNAESYELQNLDGGPAYVRTENRFQNVKFSLGQLYQFGENAWVHPYLGAGADIDYLRSTEERPAQLATIPVPNGRTPSQLAVSKSSERETSVSVHPFVKGGFKMYASDRVFFTTEWKLGLGNGLQHALWKTGFGVDF